jgi:NAD(P)-dependent dehydrogenase (short-subunit alcohol dehydrogenase family)
MELEGKVAVLTAAGGAGIGAHAAKVMAREGAAVVVTDADGDGAARVASEIEAAGGRAQPLAVDASDEAAVRSAVALAGDAFGGLDVAVHSAGVADQAEDITTMDLSEWDRVYGLNVRGAMLLARAAIPEMRRRGGGSIVFVGAAAGMRAEPTRPAYGSSKAAIHHLAGYVASYYGRFGIRCNAVSPGMTIPLEKRDGPMGGLLWLARHHVLQRVGEPHELGEVISFLASDRASFVTGALVPVDGGMSVHAPYFAELVEEQQARGPAT